MQTDFRLGARYQGRSRTSFCVWAPRAEQTAVHLLEPSDRLVALERTGGGYCCGIVEEVEPGALYRFRLNDSAEFPDPASRSQPQGVHGPSQVADTEFSWTDQAWSGTRLEDYMIYELHVGTFTPQGTFEAARVRFPLPASRSSLRITIRWAIKLPENAFLRWSPLKP